MLVVILEIYWQLVLITLIIYYYCSNNEVIRLIFLKNKINALK